MQQIKQAHNFRHLDFLQLQRLQPSADLSPEGGIDFRLHSLKEVSGQPPFETSQLTL